MSAPLEKSIKHFHISDGLSQSSRNSPALNPGYFNVHEMRFEQLLTQVQDYARLIRMPGLSDSKTNSSTQLFADDELMVMAHILAVDVENLDRDFEKRWAREAGAIAWLWEADIVASPLGVAKLFNAWLELLRFPQSNAGVELFHDLENVVIGFGRKFHHFIHAHSLHKEIKEQFTTQFVALLQQADIAASPIHTETIQDIEIKSVYASLVKSVEIIQKTTQKYLPESMRGEYHDPAAGLRIAFVSLLQKLQVKLNEFTLNYLNFYFNQVLQARLSAIHPDSTYLVLRPSTAGLKVYVKNGTEFLAGLDEESQDIIYRTDHDTEINDAKVAQVYSLYFPDHPSSEDSTRKFVDDCRLQAIPTYDSYKSQNEMTAAPFFGEHRSQSGSNSAVQGRLGFAVTSNVLCMREGQRKINVQLQYMQLKVAGCSTLEDKLAELTYPGAVEKIESTSSREKTSSIFFAYYSDIFTIQISTYEGWYTFTEYKPACHASDPRVRENCLSIDLTIPEDCPPISPFLKDVHGLGKSTSLPILRFLIKDNYLQYPYDLLKEFVLREIRITVDVEGCRDLILHNDLGQLSPLTPFAPFGPLPSVGANLIVGLDETRTKNLTRFDVDIEWRGLPAIHDGFNAWYSDYPTPKSTENFLVSASVLADGAWQPESSNDTGLQRLFSQKFKSGETILKSRQRLSCASVIPLFKPQDKRHVNKEFIYTSATKTGLFKFTLQGPPGGFGHQEYQQELPIVMTHNARVRNKMLVKKLPNPPYTPQIASISVNYSAVSVMTLADSSRMENPEFKDQFFHLHPLGWENISPLRNSRIFQLPQYQDAGNLFIGFHASEMGATNLLFHLNNDSLPMEIEADIVTAKNYFHRPTSMHPGIQWHYMANNQWHKLSLESFISDSTCGFLRTGIVSLNLPHTMTSDNTLMPSGLFWLRISANHLLKNFCHLFSVYAQAVSATWFAGKHPPSNPAMVLPANTIKRPRQNLPGITTVMQIYPSFGGVPAETQAQLHLRMSGRLKHKNRALTPRDYELLILQQFPQVFKVKCFANISTQGADPLAPGHLLIVPVPHLTESSPTHYQPYFDGYLLTLIEEFVKQLSPPFATISVENPVYEKIQVRCQVYFAKGLYSGHFHSVLNEAICKFLSPWDSEGNQVHFGWSLNAQQIEAFIYNLSYVQFVTDFSLLRIAPNRTGLYSLEDSAEQSTLKSGVFRPTHPWSIAVPIQQQYITSVSTTEVTIAETTGYDELEIGSTFIIS